jgi:hypothetical protein
MQKSITTRSKIAIRWTTNPADMGYDGTPSNWMQSAPEIRSPAGALNFAHDLSQRIGNGTYRLISYQHQGREVTLDQLRAVVETAEYRRYAHR